MNKIPRVVGRVNFIFFLYLSHLTEKTEKCIQAYNLHFSVRCNFWRFLVVCWHFRDDIICFNSTDCLPSASTESFLNQYCKIQFRRTFHACSALAKISHSQNMSFNAHCVSNLSTICTSHILRPWLERKFNFTNGYSVNAHARLDDKKKKKMKNLRKRASKKGENSRYKFQP